MARLETAGLLDRGQVEYLLGQHSPPDLLARFCTAAAFFYLVKQSSQDLAKQALTRLLAKEGYQLQPPTHPKPNLTPSATAEPEFDILTTLSAEEQLQQRAREASCNGEMIDLSSSGHVAAAAKSNSAAINAKAHADDKVKTDYSSWRVKQLRHELRTRELDTRGRKLEIVRRLEAHDAAATAKLIPVSTPVASVVTSSRTADGITNPIAPVAANKSAAVSTGASRAPRVLDAKQQEVLDRIVAGSNVFFTGSAGT